MPGFLVAMNEWYAYDGLKARLTFTFLGSDLMAKRKKPKDMEADRVVFAGQTLSMCCMACMAEYDLILEPGKPNDFCEPRTVPTCCPWCGKTAQMR
jgi:hypothetical protein